MNRALWTSIVSIGAAQALKIPLNIRQTGRVDWSDLFRTGGMPSSHSAGVVSLATYVGCRKGFSSIPFALASLLSLVVMFDAMGIRRHAGLIASQVNNLGERMFHLTASHSSSMPVPQVKPDEELEESLGHIPQEVLGGAVLGVLLGWLSYSMEERENSLELGEWTRAIRKSLTSLA